MTAYIKSNVTDVFVLMFVALRVGRESEYKKSKVYVGALPTTPKRGGSLSLKSLYLYIAVSSLPVPLSLLPSLSNTYLSLSFSSFTPSLFLPTRLSLSLSLSFMSLIHI